jgi:YgiT-type zinc finger domain-containing protein
MEPLLTEYGKCPCSGRYENHTVEVRMTVGGRFVVLKNVPQGSCPRCGSRVYKTEVLERVEALMHQRELDPRDDRALNDQRA